MGYYTKHRLEMEGKNAQAFFEANRDGIEFVLKKQIEESKDDGYFYDFEGVYNACFDHAKWNGGAGCKFYNSDAQFRLISRTFPEETFILEGVGEDHRPDDPRHWKTTYKNGEVINNWSEHSKLEEPTWWDR